MSEPEQWHVYQRAPDGTLTHLGSYEHEYEADFRLSTKRNSLSNLHQPGYRYGMVKAPTLEAARALLTDERDTEIARLLAALTQAEGERDRAYREASDARTELMADMGPLIRQIKLRDVDIARLTAERDAATEQVDTLLSDNHHLAEDRDQWKAAYNRAVRKLTGVATDADGVVTDMPSATQPPLPDPAAPQQLGLGGYASDHGKGW